MQTCLQQGQGRSQEDGENAQSPLWDFPKVANIKNDIVSEVSISSKKFSKSK